MVSVDKKPRVYDVCTIRPEGIPEDPTRCVVEVSDFSGWHFYQCSRKRGYGPNGLYCKQHAKMNFGQKGLEAIRKAV